MKMKKEDMEYKKDEKMQEHADALDKHSSPPGGDKDMPMHDPKQDKMICECMKEMGK